ncbi:GNAT family N-acetyltransferase [Cesiribacter sp. SM1]|uniref:GNAT family N-acetyltransferase n=1 Tax=Cesiribacter sp. SM1 TaxID=2861196 RepID=UPI001CD362CA|nr:GNAT family N-acetyltransferase [Cesiribacter sp. SM1]
MLSYTIADSKEDLLGISSLQKVNLPASLTEEECKKQGFVTVSHTYEQLKELNDIEKHIIVKDGQKVVAYVLAMTEQSKYQLPILVPMFELFDSITFAGKTISAYKYIVVGQVCIDKGYRGQGILEQSYATYRKHFAGNYDFAITEIASNNLRSLQAHKRIGFIEIHRYISPENIEWCIVLWNWRNDKQLAVKAEQQTADNSQGIHPL